MADKGIIEAFSDETLQKEIDIEINGTKIYRSQNVVANSLELVESVCDSTGIEFIGCISSQFKIDLIRDSFEIKKGHKIKVDISAGGNIVQLFNGYVDSCETIAGKQAVRVTAYDVLYSLGDTDIATFWNAELFRSSSTHKTIKEIRDSVFDYMRTLYPDFPRQKNVSLPNDNIVIYGTFRPEEFTFIQFIKGVCQLNGYFGIVTRDNRFEYRKLTMMVDDGAYPGTQLVLPFIPGIGEIVVYDDITYLPYYINVDLSDYKIKEIKKVSIRQTEDAKSFSDGSGKARYIVQGNPFTTYMADTMKKDIAASIRSAISILSYTPYKAETVGMPFVEVGRDVVEFYMYDYIESAKQGRDIWDMKEFPVLTRRLTGFPSLHDQYSASGDDSNTIVTDLGWQAEVDQEQVKKNTDDIQKNASDISDLGGRVENIESNAWNVQSVASLPENPDPRTIYLIQGSAG